LSGVTRPEEGFGLVWSLAVAFLIFLRLRLLKGRQVDCML
jgi:hypothetical protein